MPTVTLRRYRHAVAVAAVGLLVTAAPGPWGVSFAAPGRSTAFTCGGDESFRWSIKTLLDDPVLHPAQMTTVAALVTIDRPPSPLPPTRLPLEYNAYTVYAAATRVIPQDDGDLHVIITDGRNTMITEAPSPVCTTAAPPTLRKAMTTARKLVRVCKHAKLTGVAFFDSRRLWDRNQAPNTIELHPILGFHCLNV